MTDIFLSGDVANLLQNKTVVILGSSIVRGLYKDLVWLLNTDTLIDYGVLGNKGEESFPSLDRLDEALSWTEMERRRKTLKRIFHENNRDMLRDFRGVITGRHYAEVREYHNQESNITIIFKFISRAFPEDEADWAAELRQLTGGRNIDILLLNSGLWDINRWGPLAHKQYEASMEQLVRGLPPECAVFWLTTTPVAADTSSRGMILADKDFQGDLLRFQVAEMNHLTVLKFKQSRVNVIDLFHSLQSRAKSRNKDGIHWSPDINRLMTNKILTHLCLSLKGPHSLPGRLNSPALTRLKLLIDHDISKSQRQLKRKWEREYLIQEPIKPNQLAPKPHHSQIDPKKVLKVNQSVPGKFHSKNKSIKKILSRRQSASGDTKEVGEKLTNRKRHGSTYNSVDGDISDNSALSDFGDSEGGIGGMNVGIFGTPMNTDSSMAQVNMMNVMLQQNMMNMIQRQTQQQFMQYQMNNQINTNNRVHCGVLGQNIPQFDEMEDEKDTVPMFTIGSKKRKYQ